MSNAKLISVGGLVDRLLSLKGATFITVTVRTDARCRKTGNPFGKVFKTATVNGQVNFHYDAAVLRRLEKEGKGAEAFERGESWHVPYRHHDGGHLTPLACRKGEDTPAYLRIRHLATVGETVFTDAAGNVLDRAAVEPFLPPASTYANQGTDDPVRFLTYGLESIRTITLDGETFTVEPAATVAA